MFSGVVESVRQCTIRDKFTSVTEAIITSRHSAGQGSVSLGRLLQFSFDKRIT